MKRWLVIVSVALLVAAMTVAVSAKPIHVGGGPMLMSSPIHVGGGPMLMSLPIHVGGGPTATLMSAPIHVGGGPI